MDQFLNFAGNFLVQFLALGLGLLLSNSSLAEEKLEKILFDPAAASTHFKKFDRRITSENGENLKVPEDVDKEFSRLQRWFMSVQTKQVRLVAIRSLQAVRKDLPLQIRWLLAAMEIHEGTVSEMTIQDAESALRRTEIAEVLSLDLGVFFSGGSKSLIYEYFGPGRLVMENSREVLFLESAWQQVPVLAASLGLKIQSDERLEVSRASWMRILAKMEFDVDVVQIRNSIELLNQNHYLNFKSKQAKENYFESALSLLSNLYAEYRRTSQIKDGKLQTALSGVDHYRRIIEIVKSWLLSDIYFLAKRYDFLNRRGLLTIEEFITRPISDQDKIILQDFILKKEKLPLESYYLVCLLWSRKMKDFENAQYNKIAQKAVVDIIFPAQRIQYGMMLRGFAFEEQYLSQIEYNRFVQHFYEVFRLNANLREELALRILNLRTPRTQAIPDKDWYEFEGT